MSVTVLPEFTEADAGRVLELINTDRLPGQPECTAEMLRLAVSGSSPIDGAWWAELSDLRTRVLHGADGRPVGVVAFARRERDNAGVVLWLHAREDPARVGLLLDHALAELEGCATVEAFSFATALSLGLEALPVRHRPATHAALLERGFTGSDLWRYMRRDLPADLPVTGYRSEAAVDQDGLVLRIDRGGETVAEATIGDPVAGVGVLWWISVQPQARGEGLGLKLLGSALELLAEQGAHEAILYVDDDAPADGPQRSRAAANAMYDRAGFTEVDRLYAFVRQA
ncbi:GNAT family N-acetyltransferase [Longispora albida]|uniref:GNAT family N-acetyltransferase n=1 Tax=Longispora albida TaxID=203523 RepID=UPI0003694E22|nr:GNAT family N-acetyltransferase [Longispora albida]